MKSDTITPILRVVSADITDTWFRQLQGVSDFLTAAGFPKTADTGQVDWATVTVPAAGADTVYEVRRFDDPQQTTDPVYFKITYYRSTLGSSEGAVSIGLSVGTGSDGSGGIAGSVDIPGGFALVSTAVSIGDWWGSSDGHGFALLTGDANTVSRGFFSFERLLDATGAPLSGQLAIISHHYDSTLNTITASDPSMSHAFLIDLGNALRVSFSTLPISSYQNELSTSDRSLAFGLDSLVSVNFGVPVFFTHEGMGRTKLFLGAAAGDFNDLNVMAVERFSVGEVFHYRASRPNADGYAFSNHNSTTTATAVNYYAMPMIYWED